MIFSLKTFDDTGTIEPLISGNFKEKVYDSNLPVVVEFTLEWCGPCLNVRKSLLKLLKKYRGKVAFFTVDVHSNSQLANAYNVDILPTLIFYKDGKEMGSLSGIPVDDTINKMLESLLINRNK